METQQIGEEILAAEGNVIAVKWIRQQTVSTRFGMAEQLQQVRISAGTLGSALPHRDLKITADHGMLIDGLICNAAALVNGTTITRMPLQEMGDTYTVCHVETNAHEIILAYGAPSETFIDNVSRAAFDNHAEVTALYGHTDEVMELPHPRVTSQWQLPAALRARLSGKAAA